MLNRNVEARPSSKLLNGILSKILEKKLKFEKETIEELNWAKAQVKKWK